MPSPVPERPPDRPVLPNSDCQSAVASCACDIPNGYLGRVFCKCAKVDVAIEAKEGRHWQQRWKKTREAEVSEHAKGGTATESCTHVSSDALSRVIELVLGEFVLA